MPDWEIVALDNLHRRGSELNLARLRTPVSSSCTATSATPPTCWRVEPSRRDRRVLGRAVRARRGRAADATTSSSTNLVGAFHCLELARATARSSSSCRRAASIRSRRSAARLRGGRDALRARRRSRRSPGLRSRGSRSASRSTGARTLYGATKLAAELLIAEYAERVRPAAVVDRCGVIAGPWQMGKVDQGVFTHWVLCASASGGS